MKNEFSEGTIQGKQFHFSSLLALVPAPSVSTEMADVVTGKSNFMALIPS
jgi:hypothetical protein